ncbi:hypothetical protein IQ22_02827 [Pseudomonas duriflava]|uniref:GDSL-like lipase/acylhydrolase family protein n=1 Tax=Pseudomonas duriflava TaxID=459528 RepID=A0A562Q8C6_9PSED|nr:SGNH/GDSL hydrolase family protein [Pseudomonas duriflava]TWI52992.1 hypothetical protein IQ22_02827 [Pseudomonas duriflava]
MPEYNTGNPLGSMDPRDLFDNANLLDIAVNSEESTFQDRLGVARKTFAGLAAEGRETFLEIAKSVGSRQYSTKAAMDADLSPPESWGAIVTNDPIAEDNGWYYKSGASGNGSWVKLANQPVIKAEFDSLIRADTQSSSEGEYFAIIDEESSQIARLTSKRLIALPFEIASENDNVEISDEEGGVSLYFDATTAQLGPLEMQVTSDPGIFITDDDGQVIRVLSDPDKETRSPLEGNLLFQPTLAVSPTDESSIYVQSILSRRELVSSVVATLASTSNSSSKTGTVLPLTSQYGDSPVLVFRDVNYPDEHRYLPLTVRTVPVQSPVKTVKILFIGDSIGNRQGPKLITQYISQLGFAAQFIGTINSVSADAGNDSLGALCECREGWETGDFTYAITDRVKIIAPGSEAAYLSSTKDAKWPQNPFLRVATSSDPASIVRNGYVFDCLFYQQRFSLETPDIVINALGTNDIRDRDDNTIYNDVYSNDMLMHSQIAAAWPNAKIIRTLPGTAINSVRNTLWSTRYSSTIKAMQQASKDLANSSITIAPLWAMMNPEAGFSIPTTTDATGFIRGDWADPVHLIGSSRHSYYQAMSPFVAAAALNLI